MSPAFAQKGYRPPPEYLQFGKPDQEKGREVIEQFRRQGIAGDYYLDFELHVIPRHGKERILPGRMWGSRNAGGPISRVSVRQPEPASAPETRLLVQSGAAPALWRWDTSAGPTIERLGIAALFEPVAGTDLTPFELQLPFLYWPDFAYEGLARMRGRPAHQFLFYPPPEVAAQLPALTGIRAFLDTQYTALVQAELIGENGRVKKIFNILDLKKIRDQWIVQSIDVRDEITRNKTRFIVTAAALNQKFSAAVFDPAHLGDPAGAPTGAELVKIAAP